MFRQRRSLVVRVAVGLSTDATGGILQHSRYPRAQTRRRDVTSSLRPARESTIVRRGDGADHAVAERPRTTRAQRLAGGSRRLRGTVIDRGGVNLRAEECGHPRADRVLARGRHLRRDACRLKQLRA